MHALAKEPTAMTQRPNGHGVAIAALTLAGLISGLFSSCDFFPFFNEITSDVFMRDFLHDVFIGSCFGLALSAGLIFWGLRSAWKVLALVVTSVAAWRISVLLTMQAWSMWHARNSSEDMHTPSAVYSTGGFAGAFLLFMAVFFLLFPREKLWRITSSALAWSLGGAVLAVAGWALGPPLGKPIWLTLNSINLTDQHMDLSTAMVNEAPNYVSLFLVWQPGIAFLLGIALHCQNLRKKNATASLNVATVEFFRSL